MQEPPTSPTQSVLRRFLRDRLAALGGVVLLLLALDAILAPQIVPYDPVLMSGKARLLPPIATHLFGTDEFGRDVLSRVLYGSRISLPVGFVSVILSLLGGVPLGMVAGYYGGWLDMVISRVLDILFAFPAILLAIALMAMMGSSIVNVTIAIAVVFLPTFARLMRATVLEIRHAEFVLAARALGASDVRIMRRHILPNSLSPIIVQATLGLGYAILAEAALSYLGLGTVPPTPSWGLMINDGKDFMDQAPWLAVFPGLGIIVAVLACSLFGDGLRDALDPQQKE